MRKSQSVVYIMGAGRSGTTALSTFLGGHPKILSLADLMAFYRYYAENRDSGAGIPLQSDPFWKPVIAQLPLKLTEKADRISNENRRMEQHSAFLLHVLHLIPRTWKVAYVENQEALFGAISTAHSARWIVDSSKFVGRAISLMYCKNLTVKVLYNIRDPRGVVWSFRKNVQTPKNSFKALTYYWAVNTAAEVAYWLLPKGSVLKVRYEDIVADPEYSFARIGAFLEEDLLDVVQKINNSFSFPIGPIIEGNRLKCQGEIRLTSDEAWMTGMARWKQIVYYLACAPLMLLNGYKP